MCGLSFWSTRWAALGAGLPTKYLASCYSACAMSECLFLSNFMEFSHLFVLDLSVCFPTFLVAYPLASAHCTSKLISAPNVHVVVLSDTVEFRTHVS